MGTINQPPPERFPLTPRSSTDSLPQSSSPPSPSPSPPLPSLIRLNSQDSASTSRRSSLYDHHWSEEQESPETSERDRQQRRKQNRRIYGGGRHRHLSTTDYDSDEQDLSDLDEGGGGREDKRVGEVVGMIVAATLSPIPLLVPYACFTLTTKWFVPLLVLSALLSWSSAICIGVQGRYVGARSYPALASSVFPHRFKLHLLGEFLASSFVLGGSIVRTTLGVVAGAEVVVDLVVPERRRRDWERIVAVAVISAIWLIVPLVLPPLIRISGLSFPSSSSSYPHHYSRLASTSSPSLHTQPYLTSSIAPPPGGQYQPRRRPHWTALFNLPAYSLTFLTWPLALLILSIRMKRLNRDSHNSSQSLFNTTSFLHIPPIFDFTSPPPDSSTASPTLSLWPSILLTLSSLCSTSHETFYYQTSLARPSSTSLRSRRRGRGNGLTGGLKRRFTSGVGEGGGGGMIDEEIEGGGGNESSEGGGYSTTNEEQEQESSPFNLGGGTKSTGNTMVVGKRNQFPLAMGVGIFLSFLIQLGWALVGSIGLSQPRHPTSPPQGSDNDSSYELVAPTGNLLSDPRLPREDVWLNLVRGLVLIGILGQLEGHARVGIKRVRRGVRWVFRRTRRRRNLRGKKGKGVERRKGGDVNEDTNEDDNDEEEEEERGWCPGIRLNLPLARTLIFAIVSLLSLTIVTLPLPEYLRNSPKFPSDGGRHHKGGKEEVGGHGIGLTYLAEWAGVGLGGLGCCLIPSLTYLILFHLLPPRSILTTETTTDELLLSKEREIQRRLGGRRLWTDVAVFGILGPVGVVVVVRGVWALVQS